MEKLLIIISCYIIIGCILSSIDFLVRKYKNNDDTITIRIDANIVFFWAMIIVFIIVCGIIWIFEFTTVLLTHKKE